MAFVEFRQLPDSARLWIYAARTPLDKTQVEALERHMNHFMQEWTAHKRELTTGWELKYDRFLLVAVDERSMTASGCSIDSMVRSLREFEQRFGCQIVGTAALVFYRDEAGSLQSAERMQFKQLAQLGQVSETTVVFDNVIQTLGDFREGRWEIPMRESWHMETFSLVQK